MSQTQQFLFNGDNNLAFYGIIYYLTEKCGGNVHLRNVVKLSSSSLYNGHGLLENAVDYNDFKKYFQTQGGDDEWFQLDFVDKKIRPTHYTLCSRNIKFTSPQGENNMKFWVIEGSNDDGENKKWKILDQRRNVTCLDGLGAQNTFDIMANLEPNECFRFLRVRQTGPDSSNLYFLTFSALEFFGTICYP